MAIPETDLARINRWSQARVPERARHQVQLVAEATNRHVTIIETRAPWDGEGDWTSLPIARLHYHGPSGLWTLYWRDRNLKFHRYEATEPTPNVQALLDHIDHSGDPIFFG
ncbi:DUF3024 domain-containing protein [Pseudactinotalea sp. HY158]|uniref:DUF3024 domain-containing protein n=1 Tax=Pseudactinotalea sp. HY158 TaxID=2654547 RepID=UPI00129CC2DD|nr:DUF3024 domain-containing protein [Pseudactinotalea sp. HY158]QGH70588.1 DUF3024 domain-containing protein [Pseudactinotalea sp. HY158]